MSEADPLGVEEEVEKFARYLWEHFPEAIHDLFIERYGSAESAIMALTRSTHIRHAVIEVIAAEAVAEFFEEEENADPRH
jgi:hypothetical protein